MITLPATTPLSEALCHLPLGASESNVECQFIDSALLAALGFGSTEFCKSFGTGHGARAVDYAIRRNQGDDLFLHTQTNPFLLIEGKGRHINLQENSPGYRSTVKQLKRYMRDPNCRQTVQWGIITNANHIQLFRKHGKVIHPATRCLELTQDTVEQVIADIRYQIENPVRALTVAVYANKGGVGKTSTTINLAAVLGHGEKKKVLVIDFDPNQRDLTNSLAITPNETQLCDILLNRDVDLSAAIQSYGITRHSRFHHFFDVLPADASLGEDDNEIRQKVKQTQLKEKLKSVSSDYDYILIDCAPNWTMFSQLAMIAADVVLTPVGFNNLYALKNAAIAAKKYIAEAQSRSGDGTPIQLPVFFNGGKLTDSNREPVDQAIDEIIKTHKSEGFDLREVFYSRSTSSRRDRYIFEIPSYANIAKAVFKGVPASYQNRTVNDSYRSLAKEYFLP
jgi:cellulose biosynthesis protein BcsQ